MPEFNSIYLVYLLIGVSAAMFVEGFYLLFYNNASYRKNINRRLQVMEEKTDREGVLVQLRRERGLTAGGDYRLPLVNLNQLILQSGVDHRLHAAAHRRCGRRGRGLYRHLDVRRQS